MKIAPDALIVLCGPAGSGKTTFARRWFRESQIVSTDRLRGVVCDDEADQSASGPAFLLMRMILRLRLQRRRLTVVDSTALHARARRELLRTGRAHGVPVVALVFDIGLETCKTRNRMRERIVPDEIVEQQQRLLERTLASIAVEGFDRAWILREPSEATVVLAAAPLA